MSADRTRMLLWSDDEARIRKSSSASTAKSTVLKIEIEVFDDYRLGTLVREIREAMKPAASRPKAGTARPPHALAARDDLLALPAPMRALPDYSRG